MALVFQKVDLVFGIVVYNVWVRCRYGKKSN